MDLGKYEIIDELGRGGFGAVYKARDKVLNRIVAVKVLHPNLVNDPTFLKRFRQEAQIAAQLDNPNLVPVYDFGESEGHYYIVMGYMPGGSLKDQLQESGAFSKEKTLQVFQQIASGLAYAHKRGVIHRDLKPGNILFDEEGKARVSDMGFAKILHSDSSLSLSMSGGMIGTPSYMAPEIWRGKPATNATDIYSLACILVEMQTGETLFGGESTPEIFAKIFEPLQLPKGLPEEWKPVLEEALDKKPEERFQSVEGFLGQIREVEQHTAVEKQKPKTGATTREKEHKINRLSQSSEGRESEAPKSRSIGESKPVRAEVEKRKTKSGLIYMGFVLLAIVIGMIIYQLGKSNAKSAYSLPLETATALPTDSPTKTPTKTPFPTFEPGIGVGLTQIRPRDGMEQVYVPAGEFIMGSDEEVYTQPIRVVYLDAFWVDKFEVTNGQYEECVAAGKCIEPHENYSYGNSTYDNHPVNNVDWNQAKAYCEWAGGDLPTEAQWEKAARGTDGRKFPWGNKIPNSDLAVYTKGDQPVGSKPDGASFYGAMDMAGNVSEWVNDWYALYDANDNINPQGPSDPREFRVVRGGSWSHLIGIIRSTYRVIDNPNEWRENRGFRCVSQPMGKSSVKPDLGVNSTQIRAKDGMEMVYVPAGEFIMGSTDFDITQSERQVYLDAYWIDKFEVTETQYKYCVESGNCTSPSGTGDNGSTNDNHPVTKVDWNQAKAYCEWAGGDLPTEAQWEKAARGEHGNKYPWGNDAPTPSLLNFNNSKGTKAVGSYPEGASHYGVMDMAGNVKEWVNDWYAETYDKEQTTNPEGPKNGTSRVLRGGYFGSNSLIVRSDYRTYSNPDKANVNTINVNYNYYDVGFRCVFLP